MELPNGLSPTIGFWCPTHRFRVTYSYSHAYSKPFFSFHDSSYFKIPRFIRKLLNFGQSPIVQDCVLTITLLAVTKSLTSHIHLQLYISQVFKLVLEDISRYIHTLVFLFLHNNFLYELYIFYQQLFHVLTTILEHHQNQRIPK